MNAALLLAAGLSRRFDGPNKLLAPYRGRPLIGWAAEALGQAPVDRRVAVIGRDAPHMEQAIRTYCAAQVEVLVNPAPEDGFSSSLKLGLGALSLADWTLVMLGDMPDVDAALIASLFGAIENDAYAVLPTLVGSWGNPVILSSEAAGDSASLTGDRGARGLLEQRRDEVVGVPVQTRAIFRDVDRPADLDMP